MGQRSENNENEWGVEVYYDFYDDSLRGTYQNEYTSRVFSVSVNQDFSYFQYNEFEQLNQLKVSMFKSTLMHNQLKVQHFEQAPYQHNCQLGIQKAIFP